MAVFHGLYRGAVEYNYLFLFPSVTFSSTFFQASVSGTDPLDLIMKFLVFRFWYRIGFSVRPSRGGSFQSTVS